MSLMALQEDIFKGATRPPMLGGVPLMPVLLLVGITLLLFFWGGTLVSWRLGILAVLMAIPIYVWMRLVSRRDDQRLRQMFLRLKLLLANPNRHFWKVRSYAPVQWKGTTHVYRR